MTASRPSVFLVDDDPAIRKAVSRLVRSGGYQATPFASAEEFLASKPERGPGCLILDLRMPGLNGLQLQERLMAAGRLLPIIFISGHGDIATSVRAMKAGAVDFLPKPFDERELLQAIEQALQRDEVLRREKQERRSIDHRRQQLTVRENQVLALVVEGRLNKQIAARLGISEKTVKVHRARVMEKMHAKSLANLVRLTEKAELLTARS